MRLGCATWSDPCAAAVFAVMNWQHALIGGGLLFLGFLILICRRASRKRHEQETLDRLNSPYFRQVTDAYYRVGNISGVGR
jgi:hypothetical protein